MKLIRTGDHERTQSHSSSASIDEELVATSQNEPPLKIRGVNTGGARQPPAFENFVCFLLKKMKKIALLRVF